MKGVQHCSLRAKRTPSKLGIYGLQRD